MWGSGDMSSLSKNELIDLDTAWRRREARIPARFGSYTNYLKAVEDRLLEREPVANRQVPDLKSLLDAVECATSEAMPPWKPRPSKQNLSGLMAICNDGDPDED